MKSVLQATMVDAVDCGQWHKNSCQDSVLTPLSFVTMTPYSKATTLHCDWASLGHWKKPMQVQVKGVGLGSNQ